MGAVVSGGLGSGLGGAALGPLGSVLGGAAGTGGIPGVGNFDIGQTLGVKNGYQAGIAPGTVDQLQNAQGTYNNNIQGQQALLAALQGQANGTGVNPAQAMLNQATNQNIQQNAGMISSQKGINPALAIRQAGMNAANTSQQAAGQAATMQAQQQVNAQNQMGNVYGQIGNQALNQQNIAQQGFYAPQSINAGTAAANAKTNAGLIGGALGAAGQGAAMMAAHGGMVPNMQYVPGHQRNGYADGGTIGSSSLDPVSSATSYFNQQVNAPVQSWSMGITQKKPPSVPGGSTLFAGGPGDAGGIGAATMVASNGGKVPGKAPVKGDSYSNDVVDAKLSPGEIVIPRHITMGENPGEMAKKFVEEQLSKQGMSKKKFADGGEAVVPDYLQPNNAENSIAGQAIDNGIGNAQVGNDISGAPSKADLYNKQIQDYAKQNNIDLNDPNQKQGVKELILNKIKSQDVDNQWQQQDAEKQAAFDDEEARVLGLAPKAPAGPGGPEGIAPGGKNSSNFLPANPMSDYNSAMNKSLGMEQGAAQKQAESEQQLAQGQLGVLQDQQQDLQKVQQDYENRYADIDKQTEQAARDFQDGHIDPNHYWANKSTPGKISTVIGLVLGGLGSGLTGGENQAAKFLNGQIERDVQAQTLEMDKKKNLMSFNMQRLGNLRAAQAATMAMHYQTTQNMLQQEIAKAQNPAIQARFMQANAQIEQKKAELQRQATILSGMSGQGQGGADQGAQAINAMRMLDPKRAEELEGRYIPGVGIGSVKVPDKIREEIAGRNELQMGLQKLTKFAKEHQGSLDPATINEGKAIAAQVQDAYRRANGQGVFREAEANFVKSVIEDDPTKFLAKFRTLPQYKSAMAMNQAALNSRLKAYGFQPARDLTSLEKKVGK